MDPFCCAKFDEISSSSHLSITGCCNDCLHVSVPGPVFRALQLDEFPGITPFFENMVLLETAWHVWISLVTTMIPVGIILAEREL
jgi:hypothetical protein